LLHSNPFSKNTRLIFTIFFAPLNPNHPGYYSKKKLAISVQAKKATLTLFEPTCSHTKRATWWRLLAVKPLWKVLMNIHLLALISRIFWQWLGVLFHSKTTVLSGFLWAVFSSVFWGKFAEENIGTCVVWWILSMEKFWIDWRFQKCWFFWKITVNL
jgi:hypothetical protein